MGKPSRKTLIGAAVVALVVIGGGAAYAATTHTGSPTLTAAPAGSAPTSSQPTAAGKHHRQRTAALLGLAARVQHGELTVTTKAGANEVVDIQRGVITSVDPTSVTVRSTDGYTASYAITPTTKIGHARAKATQPAQPGSATTALRPNESVRVLARKDAAGATATRISPVKAAAAPGTPS